MTKPFLWLARRLAYVALAVTGAALVLFAHSRIGNADITPGLNFGAYIYPSSDCHEADQDAGDPINVVFYDEATKYSLDYYFNLYHGWGDNGGSTQYFKTNGLCHVMDGQPSSHGGPFPRYHARYSRGLTSSGGVDYDPLWGDYSVAAAHYEVWDLSCLDHKVPVDGFNQGRDNVKGNWVDEGGHSFAGLMYWDNTDVRIQCDGMPALSDGYVAYIRVYLDSDGDGCTDSQEAAMGFDPHNYWDFYDVPIPVRPDPTANGTKDRVVNILDVLAVVRYSDLNPSTPPGGYATGVCGDNPNWFGVDYDCDKNGDGRADGLDYDRTAGPLPNPPWDAGPPDGHINILDAMAVARQASQYLDCRPAGIDLASRVGPTAR